MLQDHAESCIEMCPGILEGVLYCVSGRKQKNYSQTSGII